MATHPENDLAAPMTQAVCALRQQPARRQAIILAAKLRAILDGRYHVARDDIRAVAHAALRHRLILNFEGQADGVSSPIRSLTTCCHTAAEPRVGVAMPLFDSDFLKKLEYLSLVSKRVFRGSLLAQRRTTQLGSGVEFADHREYTLGDDFRYLDWNLFARLDELLLKRFHEEEDLHVYFLLDCSRSMAFGEPPKFDFARQVTAALAYIALADLDRVAIVAFAADIMADLPLTRGKGRILALLKFLENLRPTGRRHRSWARRGGLHPSRAAARVWPWSSAICTTATASSGAWI